MTNDKDARIAKLEAELARRTTERDYHLQMADVLADKISANKEQPKRPVAFRVRRKRSSTDFELFTDEEGAQAAASDRGVDYEGLYLVGDRHAIAKPELWDDTVEIEHKAVIVDELLSMQYESETNHQGRFTRLFFNELGRFIKLQISESTSHVVITFEGPDSVIEHIITKQETLMLASMLLKRNLEAK